MECPCMDEELDGTPFQSEAYSRGELSGIYRVCRELSRIIDTGEHVGTSSQQNRGISEPVIYSVASTEKMVRIVFSKPRKRPRQRSGD